MQLSRILIGAMRLKDRRSAVATVRAAIDAGFNYVDCAPCYCFRSETENSETWVGEAINHPDYRGRIMVSAKSTCGNGGWQLGDFMPQKGFGVRSAAQLKQVFDQSRRRIGVERFDYYHLWTTHTDEQLAEAFKPGGWRDGLDGMKSFWGSLGLTTHADSASIMRFLDTGRFGTVTMPLNLINTTRLGVVDYCRKKGITVIAMNPFAGGFLAVDGRLRELALRYLLSLDGVHPIIGFTAVEEVEFARKILDTMPSFGLSAEQILAEVDRIINAGEPRCTACGYCQPCPQGINVGACLSYYNLYKYLGMKEAKKAFLAKQWEDGLRLDKCASCGECESKCPNGLKTVEIIEEAKLMLYRQ